jgi:hypothetical protein
MNLSCRVFSIPSANITWIYRDKNKQSKSNFNNFLNKKLFDFIKQFIMEKIFIYHLLNQVIVVYMNV